MLIDRNTKIIALCGVLLIVFIGVYGYLNSTEGSFSLIPPGFGGQSGNSYSSWGSSEGGSSDPLLTAEDAKQLAKTHINEGYPGKPIIGILDGQQAYEVPVLLNNTIIGYVYIDANTGDFLGKKDNTETKNMTT